MNSSVSPVSHPWSPTLVTLRRSCVVLAVLGLALRVAFALFPLATHLIVLEDDAWMVTAIARNFALGRGITADGINPTNGFQPLYPLTLGALPYLVAPDALDAGFTANLLICAVLNTLALWPLWSLARRFGGEIAGLLAVAIFALNPFMVRVSVNAMETSLGLLLLLTLFAAFYRLDPTRLRHVLGLALLTALATLARLDASLAFAAITITLFLRAISQAADGQRGAPNPTNVPTLLHRLGPVALYAATTLVLLAPYFAWNYSISGTFGPSSGTALAFMHSYRGDFNLTNGLRGLFLNSAVSLRWVPSPTVMLLLILGLGAIFVLGLGRKLMLALPLLLYLPIPPLYYGYLLQQARERYFVGMAAVLIVLIAWLGAELYRRRPQLWVRLTLGGAVAIVILLNTSEALAFYRSKSTEPEQTQPTSYQAALWLRANLPPNTLIAAKNSGLYQYYSGQTVLNIDGKLNHEIVPVLERRELLSYLRAHNVGYLVDREQIMADHIMFYSWQFGPAPQHRTPTLAERILIYGKIAANTLGAGLQLSLDDRSVFTPSRPFTDAARIVQRFPRPNQENNPVVVYQLKPAGESGVP